MMLTLLALCFLKVYIINANIFFRYCEMFVFNGVMLSLDFLFPSTNPSNFSHCGTCYCRLMVIIVICHR